MSLVHFAENELNRLLSEDDEMQKEINKSILDVLNLMATQGHSGFSLSYTLSLLDRLLSYKPITALTGEEDEWEDITELNDGESLQQNKRYYSIFRSNNDNSTAYNVNGKVFSDDGGESWYSSSNSSIPIIFPYVVPDEPEYVIVQKNGDES